VVGGVDVDAGVADVRWCNNGGGPCRCRRIGVVDAGVGGATTEVGV